jgi:hypothetical protein
MVDGIGPGMYAPKSRGFRQAIAAATTVAVLVSGCASRQTVVPVGQDRAELVATVERRGQENPDVSNLHQVEGPDKFQPSPEMKVVREVVRDVALITVGVAVFSPLVVLAALGHGSLAGLRPDLPSSSEASR